jgi:hypothetical protein
MPEALQPGPSTLLRLEDALFLSPPQVNFEQHKKRNGDGGHDDGEATYSPAPVHVL